jgi:hypothetical protein
MRTVELCVAGALALLSIFFMSYAQKLPIGWDVETGPGGGAMPFWLSLVMLGCSVTVFAREYRAPQHSFADPGFVHPDAVSQLVATGVAILIVVALFDVLGAYVAIPAFLLGYLRVIGGHSWLQSITVAVVTPVVMFFFFEVALQTLLPKGVTEPLFLPLYAMFF